MGSRWAVAEDHRTYELTRGRADKYILMLDSSPVELSGHSHQRMHVNVC